MQGKASIFIVLSLAFCMGWQSADARTHMSELVVKTTDDIIPVEMMVVFYGASPDEDVDWETLHVQQGLPEAWRVAKTTQNDDERIFSWSERIELNSSTSPSAVAASTGGCDICWRKIAIVYRMPNDLVEENFAVQVRRGGNWLLNTEATVSALNERTIQPAEFAPARYSTADGYKVLDLSRAIPIFKNLFYELDENPVLTAAYDELGNIDFRAYSDLAQVAWCSEFAAHIQEAAGRTAPAVRDREINGRFLFRYYRKIGAHAYGFEEIAGWTPEERRRRLPPGSIVSIATVGVGGHTLILTAWKEMDGLQTFSAISGNTSRTVRHNSEIRIPRLPPEVKDDPAATKYWRDRSFMIVTEGLNEKY
ncbi:hypothetical protein [Chelativorans sp. AA-79]|uniref:hypothetical protein n=1 Tax=Chelativorans sp. AA-79 TaxID=3028735 RepID=UPI0023F9B1C0|nr:hypothetical protein [Chelativorans sp. AA-79]WEX08257.1 hypothetical protein PVE73_19575 [Chelativorans sp. AA-79]